MRSPGGEGGVSANQPANAINTHAYERLKSLAKEKKRQEKTKKEEKRLKNKKREGKKERKGKERKGRIKKKQGREIDYILTLLLREGASHTNSKCFLPKKWLQFKTMGYTFYFVYHLQSSRLISISGDARSRSL